MLKARFPALRNLGHRLRTKRDQALAHSMILAAAVFHNLLLDASNHVENDADGDDNWLMIRGGDEKEDDDQPMADRFERREELVEEMAELEDDEIDVDAMELW